MFKLKNRFCNAWVISNRFRSKTQCSLLQVQTSLPASSRRRAPDTRRMSVDATFGADAREECSSPVLEQRLCDLPCALILNRVWSDHAHGERINILSGCYQLVKVEIEAEDG